MAKIDNYLDQSIAAAEEVRQRGVWKIYNTGNVENDIGAFLKLLI